MKLSIITLLTSVLLLLLPLANASPISSDLENAKDDEQASSTNSTCPKGDRCPTLYSCEWDVGMIPCEVNITTGRIVETSNGTIIGILDSTARLNLESLSTGPNSTSLEARAFEGERDDKNHVSSPPENPLEKRGHDYALNCGDGNGYNYRTCSGAPYRYYCKTNGGLDNKGALSNWCDRVCFCQEIFFKYCPVPILGSPVLVKC